MTEPTFRTEGVGESKKLILQCSSCKRDIRLIDDNEQLNLAENRAGYFCSNCFEEGEFVQVLHQKLPPVPMLAQYDQPIDQEEPEDYWRDAIYLGKDGDHHMVQYEDGTNIILNYNNQIRRLEGDFDGLKSLQEIRIEREINKQLDGKPKAERKKIIDRLIKENNAKNIELRKANAKSEVIIEALEDLATWVEANTERKMVLEKNDCSRLHRFKEAAAGGLIHAELTINIPDFDYPTFVVKHSWGDVLDGAKIDGGEGVINLPYDACFFEFRVFGRTIVCVCWNNDEEVSGFTFNGFVEGINNVWTPIMDETSMSVYSEMDNKFNEFFFNQINAICIALDAEVAEHEVVRAPVKLNQKREAKGKVKLSDYHVIDLSKRHRVSNPSNTGTGSKKRLHFRRGHWRHYAEHKTWVKWCLVGDPDLGFVNKHYRL